MTVRRRSLTVRSISVKIPSIHIGTELLTIKHYPIVIYYEVARGFPESKKNSYGVRLLQAVEYVPSLFRWRLIVAGRRLR